MPPKRKDRPLSPQGADVSSNSGDKGGALQRIFECKEQREMRRKMLDAELLRQFDIISAKLQQSFEKDKADLLNSRKKCLENVIQAVEARDKVATAISRKLQEIQHEFSNLTLQLLAVYHGRYTMAKEAIAQLEDPKQDQNAEDKDGDERSATPQHHGSKPHPSVAARLYKRLRSS